MSSSYKAQGKLWSLALLRVLIGWHFLYEGIVKVYNPDWTSFGYLATAQGPLKPIVQGMTAEDLVPWIVTMNWEALVFVGISLSLCVLERRGALVVDGL